jgi:hypothetical protein
MTVTEQKIIEYQDKFKSILPPWRVSTEAKTWYKNKYRFRLELGDPYGNLRDFSYTHASPLRKKVFELDPHARVRKDGWLRVFTNETALLDAFLDDPELRGHVYGLTTSNTQYIDELNNLDNIAVDVKLIGEKKYDPEIKYQVDFNTYWGWQADITWGWQADITSTKQTQRDKLVALYNFVDSNSDDLSISPALARWCKRAAAGLETYGYYYGAVRVFCRSSDNIPLMYMMFQNGIHKIYKHVKKENKK